MSDAWLKAVTLEGTDELFCHLGGRTCIEKVDSSVQSHSTDVGESAKLYCNKLTKVVGNVLE